ncbi:hypothetical protein QR685DRAFT_574338 [Neurospora intermedia]|uniref:Uncharacterized protein n=1 Tax=Neurospora intermedia TaxID=5142 RepID=A0ABR3D4A6_NEUIN
MAPNVTEASAGLNSSSRAFTRPEQSNTPHKSHSGRGIATLLTKTQAEMAWSSNLVKKNTATEALAVVQALVVARQRLCTLPASSTCPMVATVQVFTGPPVFDLLRGTVINNNNNNRKSRTPLDELWRLIQFMIFGHSHKLGEVPHVKVDLHLYWLPVKCRLQSQLSAKLIAIKCRQHEDMENIFTLDGRARPAAAMPLPVYLDRDMEHALDKKIKRYEKELEMKLAVASAPITPPVGYHDSWYGQSYDPCPEPYVSSFSDPEDFYDPDLEVHKSLEISPTPSHPSNSLPYTSYPPPMGGPPDMVSDILFPGTDKPLCSIKEDLAPSIQQDAISGTETATVSVTRTEATAEEEDDLMEEHVLEQCIRFMQERRKCGHRNEPVLEQWQEVCLKELRSMAPENPISKINRLLDEIDAMRVDISQRQKRVNEKDKEVRHLARDQPFFLG